MSDLGSERVNNVSGQMHLGLTFSYTINSGTDYHITLS